MKSTSLLLVHCLFATGLAKPAVYLGYQDSLGQYSFGYSAPGSARSEVRTSNGATRGTYSYIDETGIIQTAQYIADGENGFRVTATNLPQAPLPVQDTPEVMAARNAHLQALELATRRDEEAQSQENQENGQERKIVANQSDANLNKAQELPEMKFAESSLKEKEQKMLENAENVELKKDSDESLLAVASRSSVDKGIEKNLQGIREESSGKASQEIVGSANIPAIQLISSHALLPQAPNQVPIFRISLGSHEIEPPAIPESSIAEGAPRVILTTPRRRIPPEVVQSATDSIKNETMPEKKQQTQRGNEQTVNTLIAPLSIIPLSSLHSSFIRYISPASLRYVTYNVL